MLTKYFCVSICTCVLVNLLVKVEEPSAPDTPRLLMLRKRGGKGSICVSMCTFVLVNLLVNLGGEAERPRYTQALDANKILLRQYLYFCTRKFRSKALDAELDNDNEEVPFASVFVLLYW
jgi:hypothetical protein